MNAVLKIIHDATSFTNRPPISYKVIEYLENQVSENLLKLKKIIVNGSWEIHLVLTFCQETERYKSDYIFLAKLPRTVTVDKIKIYEALIPMKLIVNSKEPYKKTIELIFEAIKIFLTTNYKKVTKSDFDKLWEKIDHEYLLSLPYPAPIKEQRYLTDIILPSGDVGNAVQWETTDIPIRKK